jgi:peptidoglycan/xylan/chitin deacetylase (PgdA/CDA1 family)
MKIISFCYHDVIAGAAYDSSGFSGDGPARYKLNTVAFRTHLEAIEEEVLAHHSARRPGSVLELLMEGGRKQGCLLTFDGGGVSAIGTIAPMLEDFGWRGHFFIPTDYIGMQGFLRREQIRELRRRGHVIGTSSSTRHELTEAMPAERLIREWGVGKEILSEITGEEVTTAAVPSGHYARHVAEAAAIVGLKAVFTLEPRTTVESRGGCQVFGRYLIGRRTPARVAGKLAVGDPVFCAQQWMFWNAKKLAKTGLGDAYPKVRRAYFSWQRSEH